MPVIHADEAHLAVTAARHWTFDLLVVLPLMLTGIAYLVGVMRLWTRAGFGRGVPRWGAASFVAGWLILIVALMSPIAWLSEILFSVHMTQHTLLMLVAAPLLTFGQPLLVLLWEFGAAARTRITGGLLRPAVTRSWHAITGPLVVFSINAIALWVWHLPVLYQAALHSSTIHALEHVCFLAAACMFWWGMLHGHYGRLGYGVGVVYVFLTGLHSGALGALLTFSPGVWYSDYQRQANTWGFDALADQQLAGLIMWIPAGVVFIILGLALFAAWLGESERRVRLHAR
jgi:putative membrane protein